MSRLDDAASMLREPFRTGATNELRVLRAILGAAKRACLYETKRYRGRSYLVRRAMERDEVDVLNLRLARALERSRGGR